MTDPNSNPWYILMTLHGEQNGDCFDEELHRKNREAWNAWAGQSIDPRKLEEIAKHLRVTTQELSEWGNQKEAITSLHEAAMIERTGSPLEYPGLPSLEAGIHLDDLKFINLVSWNGFYFPGALVSLRSEYCRELRSPGAWFENGLYMEKSTFFKHVNFGSSRVDFEADFSRTTFKEDVWFKGVKFPPKVKFIKTVFDSCGDFYLAQFRSTGKLEDEKFHRTVFENVHFQESAIFVGCRFSVEIRFSNCQFYSGATFYRSRFVTDVSFGGSTFGGSACFMQAEFLLEKDFLPGVENRRLSVNFGSVTFSAPTSFERAVFKAKWPSFSNSLLHFETDFTAGDEFWPTVVANDARAIRSCTKIRRNQSAQGLTESEHFFFRKEMSLKLHEIQGAGKILFLTYGLFSDYGRSIFRPSISLFLLWAIGFLAMVGYMSSCCVPLPYEEFDRPIGTALAMSFSNVFPIFGLGKAHFQEVPLPLSLQVFSGLQTVLSFPLIFFLGLGLRHQFRLDRNVH